MIFKTLEIQNFMAIRKATIQLDNQGLVLIKGVNLDNPNFQSNGSGKSTILESLVYVLFGRTVRGVSKDEVVNKVAKSNCKVSLILEDDNGSSYKIMRFRKHKEQKNSVYLYCNGVDVTPKSDADFTKYIIDLLQTDFVTFTSSVLYSAESFKFTQATDSELKSAFDILLDLGIYTRYQEQTKVEIRELDNEKQKLLTRKSTLDTKKSTLEESLEELKEQSESFDKNRDDKLELLLEDVSEINDEVLELNSEIKQIKHELSEKTEQIEKLETTNSDSTSTEKALEELRKVINESEDEKSDYQKDIRNLKSSISDKESEISDLKRDSNTFSKSIVRCEKEINELKQKISELGDTVGTPCPVCGKPLDYDHIESAVTESNTLIESLEEKIKTYKNKMKELEPNISELQDDIEEFNIEIVQLDNQIIDLNKDLKKYNDLLLKVIERHKKEQESSKKLLQYEREKLSIEKVLNNSMTNKNSLIEKMKLKEIEISTLSNQQNPYLSQMENFKSKITDLNSEYEPINSRIDELESENMILNFWLDGFSNSGIKSMLLDDTTPFLNKRANEYLRELSGDNVTVNFSTQTKLKTGELREKFQVELFNKDGGDSYASNSSGEKRRVDVAINLALQDLIASRANKKINFVVIDEILDSLDTLGIDNVLNLLRRIAKEKSSVFVMSHNESIQTAFENFLIVTKSGGYSTVEKE